MIGYEAQLRWIVRDGERVLQQWWGSPYAGETGEWRDVPVVEERES